MQTKIKEKEVTDEIGKKKDTKTILILTPSRYILTL